MKTNILQTVFEKNKFGGVPPELVINHSVSDKSSKVKSLNHTKTEAVYVKPGHTFDKRGKPIRCKIEDYEDKNKLSGKLEKINEDQIIYISFSSGKKFGVIKNDKNSNSCLVIDFNDKTILSMSNILNIPSFLFIGKKISDIATLEYYKVEYKDFVSMEVIKKRRVEMIEGTNEVKDVDENEDDDDENENENENDDDDEEEEVITPIVKKKPKSRKKRETTRGKRGKTSKKRRRRSGKSSVVRKRRKTDGNKYVNVEDNDNEEEEEEEDSE